jgi:hypothetical protein
MINMSDEEEVRRFFNKFVFGFMCGDIERAISSGCNFLCALGLVAYTEVMGSLMTGKFGKDGSCERRFNTFLEHMGKEYLDLDQKLKLNGKKGLYDTVRSGLVHEYFIKGESTIRMRNGTQKTGVLVNDKGITCFIVETYFQHFKNGSEKYLRELLANEEKRRRFLNTFRDKSKEIAKVEKEINQGISGEFASRAHFFP